MKSRLSPFIEPPAEHDLATKRLQPICRLFPEIGFGDGCWQHGDPSDPVHHLVPLPAAVLDEAGLGPCSHTGAEATPCLTTRPHRDVSCLELREKLSASLTD